MTGGAFRRSYDAATRAGLRHTRAEWARIVLGCPDAFAAEVVDDAREWSDRWQRRNAGPGWASTT